MKSFLRIATAGRRRRWRTSVAESLEPRILLCGCEETPLQPVDDYFMVSDYRLQATGNVMQNDAHFCDATVAVLDQPQHGSVALQSNGDFVYTPSGTYAGFVSFTYVLSNPCQSAGPTTVTIELPNNPPLAQEDDGYFSLDQGTMTIDADEGLLANDVLDLSETNVASLLTPPQHGTVSVNPDGSFTYTPDPNYLGEVSFVYEVADGVGGTSQATVKVKVGKVKIVKNTEYQGTDVWIGETINLGTEFDGAEPMGNLTYSWSVTGQAIRDYITDYYEVWNGTAFIQQPRAYLDTLDTDDLDDSGATFHWVSDGAKTATVTVSLNGQTSTAQVQYNVQKPTLSMSATTIGINLYDYNGQPTVSLGKLNTNVNLIQWGMTLNYTLPNPVIPGDETRITQTVDFSARRTLADGTVEGIDFGGVCDHLGDHLGETVDTPSLALMNHARSYTVSYAFETYLKWHGPRPGIFVHMWKVSWAFNYTVTSANGTDWTLTTTGGTLNQTIQGVEGPFFPEYFGDILLHAGRGPNNDWGAWELVD
jgi:hypothetical protein